MTDGISSFVFDLSSEMIQIFEDEKKKKTVNYNIFINKTKLTWYSSWNKCKWMLCIKLYKFKKKGKTLKYLCNQRIPEVNRMFTAFFF